MLRVTKVICIGAVVSAMGAGCATVQDPGQAGFLSDYSKLEEIDENHLFYDSGNLGNYSKFIIDSVAMLYRQPEDKRKFSDEELEDLQVHFKSAVSEALTDDDGYQVVEVAGPGTARLRECMGDFRSGIALCFCRRHSRFPSRDPVWVVVRPYPPWARA